MMVYAGQAHWQLVEELTDATASATDVSTYVYGNYIDELIQYRDEAITTPEDYYAHQDDLFSVTVLTDDDGEVVQRYRYGDYGSREVLDDAGAPTATAAMMSHGFTGRLHVSSLSFIDLRFRWLNSSIACFIQRDPLGYPNGPLHYTYVLSSPYRLLDPLGLCAMPEPNDVQKLPCGVSDMPYRGGGPNDRECWRLWDQGNCTAFGECMTEKFIICYKGSDGTSYAVSQHCRQLMNAFSGCCRKGIIPGSRLSPGECFSDVQEWWHMPPGGCYANCMKQRLIDNGACTSHCSPIKPGILDGDTSAENNVKSLLKCVLEKMSQNKDPSACWKGNVVPWIKKPDWRKCSVCLIGVATGCGLGCMGQ